MALPALGVVNEQHAEQLFVLADRLTDTHAAAARLLARSNSWRSRPRRRERVVAARHRRRCRGRRRASAVEPRPPVTNETSRRRVSELNKSRTLQLLRAVAKVAYDKSKHQGSQ